MKNAKEQKSNKTHEDTFKSLMRKLVKTKIQENKKEIEFSEVEFSQSFESLIGSLKEKELKQLEIIRKAYCWPCKKCLKPNKGKRKEEFWSLV